MKNKIAVLISGEYRTFDIAVKTMPFLQADNVDVYFSTWDKSDQKFPELGVDIVETVTADRIRQALLPKQVAGIVIDSSTMYGSLYRYNSKMIDRWKRGLSMIKNSKIKYQLVVVMRPDIAFMYLGENTRFFRDLNDYEGRVQPNTLYTCWNNAATTKRLDDVILLARPHVMFKSLGQMSINEWNTATNDDWHDWFWKYTQLVSVNTEKIYPYMAMCFCRGTVNDGDDYETIHQKHTLWAKAIIKRDYIKHGEGHILKHWGETILKEIKAHGT